MPADRVGMLTACGAVLVLFLLAGYLANRAENAEHVRANNTSE
jgi:hypothetical protein